MARGSVRHPLFSRVYHATEAAVEQAVGAYRRRQNGEAKGRTLIVGAGTGLDVPVLGAAVTDIILLEPDDTMRAILADRYPALPVLAAPAESIPLPDAAVDTVISSLVLCSVDDPDRVVGEVARVLRPGGRFLFLEHVAHPAPFPYLAQRVVTPLWSRLGGGCRLTRDVLEVLHRSPLRVTEWETVRNGWLLPVVRGKAVRPLDPPSVGPSDASWGST
jgi:ubiquinone/menaquinone biosynthesis C-methylase UbiE